MASATWVSRSVALASRSTCGLIWACRIGPRPVSTQLMLSPNDSDSRDTKSTLGACPLRYRRTVSGWVLVI